MNSAKLKNISMAKNKPTERNLWMAFIGFPGSFLNLFFPHKFIASLCRVIWFEIGRKVFISRISVRLPNVPRFPTHFTRFHSLFARPLLKSLRNKYKWVVYPGRSRCRFSRIYWHSLLYEKPKRGRSYPRKPRENAFPLRLFSQMRRITRGFRERIKRTPKKERCT